MPTKTIGHLLLVKNLYLGSRREPDNSKDHFAVIRDGEIVGHVPFNLSSTVSQFLRRHYNMAIAAQQCFHF